MVQVEIDVFLRALLTVSEKAANVARCCRAEERLFSMLIQEKGIHEKNSRFLHDFKTLADVLVQELIRYDLDRQFPGISERIRGEESNHFTSTEGKTIDVLVGPTESETRLLLSQLLDDDAAGLLSETLFRDVQLDLNLNSVRGTVDLQKVGIWIDPIDSTSEYIHGKSEDANELGIVESGLQCACVLIGAFCTETGLSLFGVVNQPFVLRNPTSNLWTGSFQWGVSLPDVRYSSLTHVHPSSSKGVLLASSSESHSLIAALRSRYRVVFPAGAGYKFLAVASGLAQFYVLSRDTTFRWDSCGPNALLLASGGGIISYERAVALDPETLLQCLPQLQLRYERPEQGTSPVRQWCNKGGIIAYRDPEGLAELVKLIREM